MYYCQYYYYCSTDLPLIPLGQHLVEPSSRLPHQLLSLSLPPVASQHTQSGTNSATTAPRSPIYSPIHLPLRTDLSISMTHKIRGGNSKSPFHRKSGSWKKAYVAETATISIGTRDLANDWKDCTSFLKFF